MTNTSKIRKEDFDEDDQAVAERLGAIINPFLQEVVEIMDGNVDFDNRTESIKQFDITVDSNGTPTTLPFNIKVDVKRPQGTDIIKADNFTNTSGYPSSQPFISFTRISDNIIRIDNVSGLRPNEKYKLTLVIY